MLQRTKLRYFADRRFRVILCSTFSTEDKLSLIRHKLQLEKDEINSGIFNGKWLEVTENSVFNVQLNPSTGEAVSSA